jgi:secreted PhoX family phosphatase
MATTLDRRTFLRRGTIAAGGVLSAGAIGRLAPPDAVGNSGKRRPHRAGGKGYGPLRRVPDQRGVEVLALPKGFSYVTFGYIGSKMADGNTTPLALDGMSAFPDRKRSRVRLVRNHEDRNPAGAGSVLGDPAAKYDPDGGGGTSTLIYDEAKRSLVADFISLNGTTVNCAGGIGFRRRHWITAEETVRGPDASSSGERFSQRHGYLFEVPVSRGPGELTKAEPIRAAGRFAHEAVAVSQKTGIVYQTEDPGSGVGAGFYRFIPENPSSLLEGGKLQMLAISGLPQLDMRENQIVGRRMRTDWVDIDDPDPAYASLLDPKSTFMQGHAKGGALFNRLEGCWYDEGSVFFVSTSGGDAKSGDVNSDGYEEGFGQVWEYRPHRGGGFLTLLYESPSAAALDSPDNLTVTPRGGLIACEDDASSANPDGHPLAPGIENVNRVIGLTQEGDAFELAVNVLNDSEFAGCCFSPSGETLFVNVFGRSAFSDDPIEGMTCAITGPWKKGPL